MAEPKVRFNRDDGIRYPEWITTRLSDLFQRINERNNGQFDNTKWISVAKMYYQDPDKVQSNNIDTRTYVMRYGDIAFEGHPNDDFMYGRFVLNDIGDGVISELFPIYRFRTEYVLKYWKYAIQVERVMSPVYRKAITSSGASSNKLNEDDFLRETIHVPCLEEQQKIADFLSSVDDVISASEQEVANLETQKKAVMKKIFSQEVRFKKADGSDFPEWEEKRIGDICKTYSGGTPKAGNDGYYGGNIPFIRSGEIHSDSTELFLTEEGMKNSSAKMVAEGDIIMALYGATSGEIDISKIEGAINQAILCIKPEDSFDRKFVVEVFRNYKDDILKTYLQGGQGNLSAQIVQGLSFEFPCVEEQRSIADFLSDFDEAIAMAKKELELWKKLKKGLLQQMFV